LRRAGAAYSGVMHGLARSTRGTTLLAAVLSGLATVWWRKRHPATPKKAAPPTAQVRAAQAVDAVLAQRAHQAAPPPEAAVSSPARNAKADRRPTPRELLQCLKKAAQSWSDDYAPSLGASLSYYTLFSIAPLLLIVIAVAGLAFGEDAARGAIFAQLRGFLGNDGAQAIEGLLKSASLRDKGVLGTAIGVVLLIVGATTVLAELQRALDRIWRAPERNKPSGWRALVRSRLLSLGMILGIGFLLMVSLVASAATAALGEWWAPWFGALKLLLEAVNFVVSFSLVTAMFALIYKLMPRVQIAWHDVWVGAAFTALLFTIGKVLIGLYLGKSAVASGFGAASSVVLLLVWVYYSAQIFLIGAEFTWVYAHRFGSRQGHEQELDQPPPHESGRLVQQD
jgi:membrane protein